MLPANSRFPSRPRGRINLKYAGIFCLSLTVKLTLPYISIEFRRLLSARVLIFTKYETITCRFLATINSTAVFSVHVDIWMSYLYCLRE